MARNSSSVEFNGIASLYGIESDLSSHKLKSSSPGIVKVVMAIMMLRIRTDAIT